MLDLTRRVFNASSEVAWRLVILILPITSLPLLI